MKLDQALDGHRILRLANGSELRVSNLAAVTGLALVAGLISIVSLSTGLTQVGLLDLLRGDLSADHAFAVFDIRAPRLLVGFMAGWCLAMTGAMLQSLTQNPLADPGLLGIGQGAMVTIMILLIAFPTAAPGLVPIAALLGGLAVALMLGLLLHGAATGGLAILLVGIALDTVLTAITGILILYTPAEISLTIASWLAGSLYLADWQQTLGLIPWAALSLPIILFVGPLLRPLDLGEEQAIGLGLPLGWVKPLLLIVAVLLTSTAVTAMGPLAFLGIMAPHLAQFLSPASGRMRLVLASLMGGTLVLAADLLARLGPQDFALPLGLSLTLLGVPLFVITLRLRALRNLN